MRRISRRLGEEEAGKIAQEYRQASTQTEQEYAEKKELSAGEAAELSQLWRKLVKLFHPDRFAYEPEKQMRWGKFEIRISKSETNSKSVKAGKWERLHRLRFPAFPFLRICFGFRISIFGFSLRREHEIAQLRRLWESLELEIIRVLVAHNALKPSPDYELHRLTTKNPAFFDETVKRHVESLEELFALESQPEELAKEIEELTGEGVLASKRRVGD